MQLNGSKLMNSDEPKVDHTYQHFKGNFYHVIEIAHHTELDQRLVIYKNDYGQTWARPIEEWNKPTEDGVKRFSEVIVRRF